MGWLVCENPERAPDADALWHCAVGGQAPCRGCLIAVEAQYHQEPDPAKKRMIAVDYHLTGGDSRMLEPA